VLTPGRPKSRVLPLTASTLGTALLRGPLSQTFWPCTLALLRAPISGRSIGSALDGLVLSPGVYASPSYLVNGAALTFDGQGDPNSVWVIRRFGDRVLWPLLRSPPRPLCLLYTVLLTSRPAPAPI